MLQPKNDMKKSFEHHHALHLRKKPLDIFKKMYLRFTGYSYSNLGRLFLRLFVGLMLLQFGIRQIYNFRELQDVFPAVLGMSSQMSLISMISIELICSTFLMFGFMTRIMVIPPFVAMIIAEFHLLYDVARIPPYLINWDNPVYLPVMFLGILFFILLVGPGKISVDYFISLNIIQSANRIEEEELEEI